MNDKTLNVHSGLRCLRFAARLPITRELPDKLLNKTQIFRGRLFFFSEELITYHKLMAFYIRLFNLNDTHYD